MVEETSVPSHLDHACLAHGLLHDDVKDLAHRLAGGSVRTVDVGCVHYELSLSVDHQLDLLAHQLGVKYKTLLNLLFCPKIES